MKAFVIGQVNLQRNLAIHFWEIWKGSLHSEIGNTEALGDGVNDREDDKDDDSDEDDKDDDSDEDDKDDDSDEDDEDEHEGDAEEEEGDD